VAALDAAQRMPSEDWEALQGARGTQAGAEEEGRYDSAAKAAAALAAKQSWSDRISISQDTQVGERWPGLVWPVWSGLLLLLVPGLLGSAGWVVCCWLERRCVRRVRGGSALVGFWCAPRADPRAAPFQPY
jgi:hypothetical protein